MMNNEDRDGDEEERAEESGGEFAGDAHVYT